MDRIFILKRKWPSSRYVRIKFGRANGFIRKIPFAKKLNTQWIFQNRISFRRKEAKCVLVTIIVRFDTLRFFFCEVF